MATDLYIRNDGVIELQGLKDEIPAASTGETVLSVQDVRTFSRATGDFLADGFAPEMELRPAGFVNAINNKPYTIAAVDALTITVNEECLVPEQGDGCESLDGLLYLNSSTVTVTVFDRSGVEVNGEVWPLTMIYVAGSFGTYRTTLPWTMELQVGRPYIAQVVSDAGLGLRNEWDMKLKAVAREA